MQAKVFQFDKLKNIKVQAKKILKNNDYFI